jgi:hypothetical protein
MIQSKFGFKIENCIDLALAIRENGEKETVGARRAVLRYLHRIFEKSKDISISDWSIPIKHYKSSMILYAANDAHVALLVYYKWKEREVESAQYNN